MKKKYYGKMDEETVRELAKVSKKMFSGKDGKKRFLIALVLIICALSAMLIFSEDARNYVFSNAEFVSKQSVDGVLEVHFIDVGQGDSELIIADDGSTMLIDAGPNSSEESLLRYLKTNNIEKLDVVVFTHPHEDHIGGGDYILNNIPADKVIMPDITTNTATFERLVKAVDKCGADVQIAQSGDTFNFGSATVKILAPNSEKYDSLNDYSVVLHLTFGETSFMFTGDAEKKSEYEILAKYPESELKSDVLKLGHHGSSTSNSDAFLAAVDPTVAVAECGVDNDYGHPHREIVKALEKLNIKFFRTDKDGSVIILSDGKNIVSSK